MNNATLAQATLLALTMQNQAHKIAPLSTARMQGVVINQNIKIGETVCCYLNTEGAVKRIGDSPNWNSFFVDDNNLMYDMYNGKLRVRNALNLEVINPGELDIYDFGIYGGGALCAYKVSNETNTWVFRYQDGSVSNEITLGGTGAFRVGYRNGILAINPVQANGDNTIYTYTQDGTLLHELATLGHGIAYPAPVLICPINEERCAVAVAFEWLTFYDWGIGAAMSAGFMFENLYQFDSGDTHNWQILGADQSYMYIADQMHDEDDTSILLDTKAYCRFSIEDYDGAEVISIGPNADRIYSPCSTFGHIIRQHTEEGVATRNILDISTMTEVYTEEMTALPANATVIENDGYIWVSHQGGVWMKTPLGWLMYPTSTYPRSSPWGKLGYAIRNAKIGDDGLAIVLFE